MGKDQKKRAMRRHNPMRVPDSHLQKGLASASTSSSKSNDVLPIIQKLESPESTERKWACIAVSNLIHNDPSTRRLLQGKNIVGALITRLTDSEEEVVTEAAGALRNLCIDGGYDICAEMYNKNILVPLKSFVPKISATLSQYLEAPKSAPDNAKTTVHAFAENIITILWCLSETSHKALNAINELNLVPFLMSFLACRDQITASTVASAAQCLYVLTEDNPPASREIKHNGEYVSCLLSIARPDQPVPNGKGKDTSDEKRTTLLVLASGILRNVSPIPPPNAASGIDIDKEIAIPNLLPVISSISLPACSTAVMQQISNPDSDVQMDKPSIKGLPKSDHKSATESELERLEEQLKTVQLALEILTGVCATLPDPTFEETQPNKKDDEDNDEDMEGDQDQEEGDRDSLDMDDDTIEDDVTPSSTSTLLPGIVQHVLTLIHPTPISFPPFGEPSPCPPITVLLSSIHINALQCLNNIFLSLATSSNTAISEDKESGKKVWDEVWKALSVAGTKYGPGQERREEMWSVAVGVLWGIGMIWKGSLVPSEEEIQVLMQYYETSSDPATRVKCIGTLECLAQHPDSVAANQTISNFLFTVLQSPTSGAEPIIQAASALIDIYSDEELPYDVNFRQYGYAQKLDTSLESVKKAVKSIDRNKEGGRELRKRGDVVRMNLVDFIKYRKSLRL